MTVKELKKLKPGNRVRWEPPADSDPSDCDTACDGTVTDVCYYGLIINWDDGKGCHVSFDESQFASQITALQAAGQKG